MSLSKPIFELVEEIRDLAERASKDDARSALIYCVKQLKIAASARRQEEESDESSDDDEGYSEH